MIVTAGIYKGRKIIAPDEKITRPTLSKVRMGVFNTLFSIIGEFDDKSFFDVFGGSGIMGIEALSRGFKEVVVCELNRKSAEIIKKNYSNLGIAPNLKIGDSTKLIKKMDKIFDVVYIDPPYKSDAYKLILPFVKGCIVVVEHDEEVDFGDFEVIKQKNYGGKFVTFLKG